MIICKTPFRISLLGGGTDFPKYYLKNSGCVIGGTIDKYCYVTARFLPKVFNYKHRIVWSKNETVNNINQIFHPTVKAVFKSLNVKNGLEIHYQGDLQKNSGLGTSSSFCVGLINAITTLNNNKISKNKLALKAINVEQYLMKENCGSQDQIWASHGGMNFIRFNRNGKFSVNKLKISNSYKNKLNDNLVLIYTGIHKYSDAVEKDKLFNLNKNLIYLDKIKLITEEFKNTINNTHSIDLIGEILNEYWHLKKKLSSKVTNNKINEIYKIALTNGATGGKIIGSGGGGYLLIYCKKKFQKKLKNKLNKLVFVNFKFTEKGSEIIFKS